MVIGASLDLIALGLSLVIALPFAIWASYILPRQENNDGRQTEERQDA